MDRRFALLFNDEDGYCLILSTHISFIITDYNVESMETPYLIREERFETGRGNTNAKNRKL